jgi:hypothetical protein
MQHVLNLELVISHWELKLLQPPAQPPTAMLHQLQQPL